MGSVANVKVEPMVVYLGEAVAQVQTITTVADSANSLDGKYFFLYTPGGVGHYFWFNTSGGSASDPALAGFTAHEVALTTGDSANAVATALEAVIEAVTGFNSEVSSNTITVTCTDTGYAQAAHDGNSGFTFAVTTVGDSETDLGFINGDIEVSMERTFADVTAHEHGTSILDKIPTGASLTVTLALRETSLAQLKKIFNRIGNSFTPTGASGTEVFGVGSTREFTSLAGVMQKLRLHPKVLSASNKTRDITFHKVIPDVQSLAFSGENPFEVPVTFHVFKDTSKNTAVNYMVIGDSSQTLT